MTLLLSYCLLTVLWLDLNGENPMELVEDLPERVAGFHLGPELAAVGEELLTVREALGHTDLPHLTPLCEELDVVLLRLPVLPNDPRTLEKEPG